MALICLKMKLHADLSLALRLVLKQGHENSEIAYSVISEAYVLKQSVNNRHSKKLVSQSKRNHLDKGGQV